MSSTQPYRGNYRLILGIVLAVITFWLFGQTTLNVAPVIAEALRISTGMRDLAVSITPLFSGIFIIVAGDLADRFGRVRLTFIGLGLSGVLVSLINDLNGFYGPFVLAPSTTTTSSSPPRSTTR